MKLLTSAFWSKVSRGHKRSLEVKNHKKGQISNFDRLWEIIYKNDALDVCFLKKVVARSPEVIWGHKSRMKVKFESFSKVDKLYLKMKSKWANLFKKLSLLLVHKEQILNLIERRKSKKYKRNSWSLLLEILIKRPSNVNWVQK